MSSGTRPKKFLVDFEPVGRKVNVAAGSTLLDAAIESGIEIVAVCGGSGTCGSCKVKRVQGILSEITSEEEGKLSAAELKDHFRLACQAKVLSDVLIEIPPQSLSSLQRVQTEGESMPVTIHSPVIGLDVEIKPPSINDLRADDERIVDECSSKGLRSFVIRNEVMNRGLEKLRGLNWKGRLVVDRSHRPNELVTVLPSGRRILGFAADLGTTKLAMYIVDLETGETIAKTGVMNPQIAYGEDVVSRIAFCNRRKDGRSILQKKIIEALNHQIHLMCKDCSVNPDDICAAVLVGNTAMHHIITGLPVAQLGEAPYVPAVAKEMIVDSDEIGLKISPGAKVYLPPNVAGYVGSDHLAFLLSAGIPWKKINVMAMDIGTNTEISLSTEKGIFTCSCASGPAFEGAHIQFGMRAARGAIERVHYDDSVEIKTIGNAKPIGICGSGILDAVAEFRKTGILDKRGVFNNHASGVRSTEKGFEFVLVKSDENGITQDITVNRKDVNEIQLAKAAIQAGWVVLLENAGLKIDQIDLFIIAGAFGSYINIGSAITIGMLPDLPISKFRQVGNAAGMGAKQLLLSTRKRKEVQTLKSQIRYVELTTYPGFVDHYYKALYL